jgi:cobalt/nickel transport system permease protein
MQPALPAHIHRISVWHRMDARWKLGAVLIALLLFIWIRSVPGAFLCLALNLLILCSARLPLRWWLDRFAGVGLFLLMAVCLLPFSVQPTTWSWSILHVSQNGLLLAAMILFKALAATALALLLFGTESIETTLHAASALRTPSSVLRILFICWRYVQVMYEVIQDFRIALRLRGFRNHVNLSLYRTISRVVGTMLILGFERSERAAQAMRCRGYQGHVVSLESFHTDRIDPWLFLCLILPEVVSIMVDAVGA